MASTEAQKAAARRFYHKNCQRILAREKQQRASNPVAAADKARQGSRRWREMNPDAKRAETASWRERNPGYYRRWALAKNYGLTLEDYDRMLDAQGGGCAICGDEPWTQSRGVLHVDHCHSTGRVRGLLCQPCNHALGSFRDRTDLLSRAITYLKGIL